MAGIAKITDCIACKLPQLSYHRETVNWKHVGHKENPLVPG